MEPYNLTELQFTFLSLSYKQSKEGEVKPALMAEPAPLGSYDDRAEAEKKLAQMYHLVTLGLAFDVTESQKELNDKIIEACGYGGKFFLISKDGLSMFDPKNLVVN